QAEDGIRDFHVTGVQTCALPILNNSETEAGDDEKDQKGKSLNLEVVFVEAVISLVTRLTPLLITSATDFLPVGFVDFFGNDIESGVVARALDGVGKGAIRFVEELEGLLCFAVSLGSVGMITQCQLLERSFDLRLAGCTAHPQGFVEILHATSR